MTTHDAWPKILKFTLAHEGGATITENPHDPGGLTKWGVSQRAYPRLDIRSLTREQAEQIYLRDYWEATGCPALPAPVAAALFDSAVNCGCGRAKHFLAVTRTGDPKQAEALIDAREGYYHTLAASHPALRQFLPGWLNRTRDLRKLCERLV